MKVQFNMVTMKDGKINVEEKPELSKALENKFCKMLGEVMIDKKTTVEEKPELSELLSQSMANHAEFTKDKKEKAMDLPEGFYSNEKNSTFFTSELETMANILTDEIKRDKVLQRISEGKKFGTFKRFKTQQPFLVRAYKTRKGAEQNTFWRNH